MTYTFGDFIGLLIVGWIMAFVLHQFFGGVLGLINRALAKRNKIVVELKEPA